MTNRKFRTPAKILFASSYPRLSQSEMVDHYVHRAGFRKEVLTKVMGENARALFQRRQAVPS